jgi:cobalt-zinc-cadmium efflux system outer membrane protein
MAQGPSPSDTPLALADHERMAVEGNPTLKQADAEIDAARGRARQAGLLPNPTMGYTGEEIGGGPIIRGGEHGFFVEQTIPLGGKLRLSRQVFEREATQAEALLDVQRARVLNTVRILYYAALAAAHRVEVNERLAQLAAEAVTISHQLYNVGAADRPDLLESEIEARRSRLALIEARNGQFSVWRRLAMVVGNSELGPRPLAGSVDEALPELERTRALQTILRDSPEIKAARAAAERAELALRRARREPVPDLVLRGGPRYNRELLEIGPGGARPVGWEAAVDVGLTIPLFNRNQGNVAAAAAARARARAELQRLELGHGARLADLFEQYLSSLRSAEVYRGEIVPRAEEAYNLYVARYREMAAAYPQVLIAQRTLFQVTEAYVDAVEATWRSAVQIQGFLLGEGLDAPARPGEAEPAMPGVATTGR